MNENRLDGLKEERDLKSRDIAKHLKVNESTYSEWEHNKIPIPTRRIVELADFYNVNIDYMLKLTDTRKEINGKTKLDLSLRGLGEKLNCSFSSLGSYERGENLINCEILISLSKYSKYSIDYILGRSNKKMNK